MPLMTIRTNVSVDDGVVRETLAECSGKLAKLLGKPESYVMTLFDRVVGMTMSGTDGPACLVEVRSVGKLSGSQTQALTQTFCALLSERLGVRANRIFMNFTDFSGDMWGHDGSTFG